MTNTETLKGEIANICTCDEYDDVHDEYNIVPCEGHCWEDAIEDFAYVTNELRKSNETQWWKVTNLRLWNGEVSGFFIARGVSELVRGMTVNSEWRMTYEVFADRIEYSLAHHDAPTGSASVLTPVSAEEVETLGLYA